MWENEYKKCRGTWVFCIFECRASHPRNSFEAQAYVVCDTSSWCDITALVLALPVEDCPVAEWLLPARVLGVNVRSNLARRWRCRFSVEVKLGASVMYSHCIAKLSPNNVCSSSSSSASSSACCCLRCLLILRRSASALTARRILTWRVLEVSK